MTRIPESLRDHRASAIDPVSLMEGCVVWDPARSLWLLAMSAGAAAAVFVYLDAAGFAVFVTSTAFVLLFGHSVGMHRKLIHESFQCHRYVEYFLVYCGVLVGLAGPLGLLRAHELRDYAQRLPHCHPYLRHGSSVARDAWWQLHCRLELRHPPTISVERRVSDDRFFRFLEATWRLQQLPWALLLYGLGGPGFVCWGVCARVMAGVVGHWLIGFLAHNHGQVNHQVVGAAVQGRNVRLTSLLTMGECWHNNHHAFPGSAKLGLGAGEWDPGWWLLQLLKRCGLVWAIRLPADLPTRPEVVPATRARGHAPARSPACPLERVEVPGA